MAYCRWSSDNFRCELYCYSNVYGGYTTHVAGNKIITPVIPPLPLSFIKKGSKLRSWLWTKIYNLHLFTVRFGLRRNIGLPFDRQSFDDETLEGFRDRLIHLREVGYRFPDYVLEVVNEEIAEENAAQVFPVEQ